MGEIMKKLLILGIFTLQSCAMIAGRADYTVSPIVLDNGKIICCEVKVSNSKDIGNVSVEFNADGKGGIAFKLVEQDVNSSTPAAVAADTTKQAIEALTKALDKL